MEWDWAEEFYAEGLITEVLMRRKNGKEATVYLCRRPARRGGQFGHRRL